MASGALALSTLIALPVFAEHHDGPTFFPTEIFVCNYNEGMGPADLDSAVDAMNTWADSEAASPYSAWTFTRNYTSAAPDFDVVWMGAWPNGNTMGASLNEYMSTGGAVASGFAKTMNCPTHSLLLMNALTPPREGGPPKTAVAGMSDCTIADSKEPQEVTDAMAKWAGYLREHGVDMGLWMLWPMAGGDQKAEWDFKVLTGYDDYAAYGAFIEKIGNGRGYEMAEQLFDDMVSCDSTRVYDVQLRRDRSQ